MDDEIAKSLIEVVGKEFYQDTIQPASKKVGVALAIVADTANTIVMPVKALNWGGRQLEEWVVRNVALRLKNIDESELTKPSKQTLVQAMHGLSICFEELELREMFANIIAATLCESTKSSVHPCFPTIIQQLSQYEAKLVRTLFTNTNTRTIYSDTLQPYEYEGKGDDIYFHCLESLIFDEHKELNNSDSLSMAFDNLRRLQIINTRTETFSEYLGERVEQHEIHGPEVSNTYSVDISFTGMGWQLLECCVSKKL